MLVPQFNKYPKPTDWNSLYILAQQAFEDGFRAFTYQDLVNKINGWDPDDPENPGGVMTVLASPFKVRVGDDQYSLTPEGALISDARLMSKEDYPVGTTQLNVTFRLDELEYYPDAGSVLIKDFELSSDEEIILYPAGATQPGEVGGALQALIARVSTLENMVAPLLSGGRMWWKHGAETIPPGWIEDTEDRGYIPMHAENPSLVGNTGGSNSITLTSAQMPPHHHKLFSDQTGNAQTGANITADKSVMKGTTTSGNRDEKYALLSSDLAATLGMSSEVGQGQSIDTTPRHRKGMWIKYVGA